MTWFEGYDGSDPEVLAFLQALSAGAEREPLPVDPEEAWVLRLGACLYIAVTLPVDGRLGGAEDLEVFYWPAEHGRGVEGGWGDATYPMDMPADVPGGRLALRDAARSAEDYAAVVLAWLRDQLARARTSR